jgi:hypothetical protein
MPSGTRLALPRQQTCRRAALYFPARSPSLWGLEIGPLMRPLSGASISQSWEYNARRVAALPSRLADRNELALRGAVVELDASTRFIIVLLYGRVDYTSPS